MTRGKQVKTRATEWVATGALVVVVAVVGVFGGFRWWADHQLYDAVSFNDLPRIKQWVRRGASVNLTAGISLHTPLTLATLHHDEAFTFELLKRGAKPDPVDVAGFTPLAYVVGGWNPGTVSGPNSAQLRIARALIDAGSSVDLGRPLLTTTCPELAELLLRHGADPNVSDGDGRTPLMQAAEIGSPRLAEILIRHGARLDLTDSSGMTAKDHADEPTMYPKTGEHNKVLELLVTRG